MVLITGRQLEHWHTGAMTRRAGRARRASSPSRWRRCIRSISRSSARSEPGDIVTVESRRGKISLYARADEGTPRGAVFIPFAFYEAAANMLTNPALDPFGKIPEFKYCAVQGEPGRRKRPGDPGYGKGVHWKNCTVKRRLGGRNADHRDHARDGLARQGRGPRARRGARAAGGLPRGHRPSRRPHARAQEPRHPPARRQRRPARAPDRRQDQPVHLHRRRDLQHRRQGRRGHPRLGRDAPAARSAARRLRARVRAVRGAQAAHDGAPQASDEDLVAEEIRVNDEAHSAIMRRHFGVQWTESEHYDLVLNTERVSRRGMRRRGAVAGARGRSSSRPRSRARSSTTSRSPRACALRCAARRRRARRASRSAPTRARHALGRLAAPTRCSPLSRSPQRYPACATSRTARIPAKRSGPASTRISS